MDLFDEHTKQIPIVKKYVLGQKDPVDKAGDMIQRAGDEDVGRRLPRCACGLRGGRRGGAQGQRPARRNFARLTWLKNFAVSTQVRAFAPKSRKISLTPAP